MKRANGGRVENVNNDGVSAAVVREEEESKRATVSVCALETKGPKEPSGRKGLSVIIASESIYVVPLYNHRSGIN